MAPEAVAEPRQTSAAELKAQIEAEREGRPFLVYRDGEGEQQIHAIGEGEDEVSIGRSPSTALNTPWDANVSGLHAQITVIGGECTLVDDGLSRNGTFVNEERVQGRRRLRDGDVIRVGTTSIAFRAPGGAEIEATVAAAEGDGPQQISAGQRRVLVELCRPFKEGSSFATAP